MKFRVLAKYIKEIEETSSRNKITELLSALFLQLQKEEIKQTIYLLQGRLVPLYESKEFGMAEKLIIIGAMKALNISKEEFNKAFKSKGDLGLTVESFKKSKSKSKSDLSIGEVFKKLNEIAEAGGIGSQEIKIGILAELISNLDTLSSKYLVRIPVGAMRLGFSDMTILDSLSWMMKGDKSLRPILQHAYHVRPNLGEIAENLKNNNLNKLKNMEPEVFTPIIMMRAERMSSGEEIINQIGKCAVESKYDGFRLQIHKKGKEIRMYSRNLDDVSHMYPDLAEAAISQITSDEVILEGEAIGFNPKTQEYLPFQETVQRKRKYGIAEMKKSIPLHLFLFDLLYINNRSYIDEEFSKRRLMLEKSIKLKKTPTENIIRLAPQTIVENGNQIEKLFDIAVKKNLEGLIAKKITGVYKPGAREWNWIKFKKSYSSKIIDTIDCLIMGYDFGKGKRTDFGIGAFLVGVYDKKNDSYATVAKIGTGLTDAEWKELKKRTENKKVSKKPNVYKTNKQVDCDIWIKPAIVVEIKSDEITKSPLHSAGLALRFPRLERFRDDKLPSDTTSLEELKKLYTL
ncbi:MAG: ATP-dependent DNA ligase [Patescibacteria group bacterium]